MAENLVIRARSSQDQRDVFSYHYYCALALEFLNRRDEALAEYVAIYEAAPDYHGGMLAALHLTVP